MKETQMGSVGRQKCGMQKCLFPQRSAYPRVCGGIKAGKVSFAVTCSKQFYVLSLLAAKTIYHDFKLASL